MKVFNDESVNDDVLLSFVVLIEKLLRSCKDIDTIYVLIRNKKGQDGTARLHAMLDDFVSIIFPIF